MTTTYKCDACGCPRRLTRHHVVPLEFGGRDHSANMMTLCEPCHMVVNFRADLSRLPSYYDSLVRMLANERSRPAMRKVIAYNRMVKRLDNPEALEMLKKLREVVDRLTTLQSSRHTVLQDVFGVKRVADIYVVNTLQNVTTG